MGNKRIEIDAELRGKRIGRVARGFPNGKETLFVYDDHDQVLFQVSPDRIFDAAGNYFDTEEVDDIIKTL